VSRCLPIILVLAACGAPREDFMPTCLRSFENLSERPTEAFADDFSDARDVMLREGLVANEEEFCSTFRQVHMHAQRDRVFPCSPDTDCFGVTVPRPEPYGAISIGSTGEAMLHEMMHWSMCVAGTFDAVDAHANWTHSMWRLDGEFRAERPR
jgi:hypothetical protein